MKAGPIIVPFKAKLHKVSHSLQKRCLQTQPSEDVRQRLAEVKGVVGPWGLPWATTLRPGLQSLYGGQPDRNRDSHSWFRHFVPTDLSDIRRTCYGDHEYLPCPLWEVLCCKWKTCSKVKRPPAELTMTDRASELGLCQSSSVDVYGKHTKRFPAVGNAQHGMQGCRRALSGSALQFCRYQSGTTHHDQHNCPETADISSAHLKLPALLDVGGQNMFVHATV